MRVLASCAQVIAVAASLDAPSSLRSPPVHLLPRPDGGGGNAPTTVIGVRSVFAPTSGEHVRLRIPAILLAGTLVLAACGNDDNSNGDGANGEPEMQDEAAPQDSPEPDDLNGADDPQAEDLPDPNEMVSDGVFSGQGMVLD